MLDGNPEYEGSGFISDHSTLFLIFSNIIMIFLALFENWDLITIMFIFWCQSVIIGIFTFFKILDLKNFTTDGFYINNKQAKPTKSTKTGTAFFFLFHYGFFHFVYLIFILANPFFNKSSTTIFTEFTILIAVSIFFANHFYSFIYNREKNANKKQNIGKVMFFPYMRIIPMHLTIIFGSFFLMQGLPQLSLILFLLLKTGADVGMHLIEHKQDLSEKLTISLKKSEYRPGEEIIGKIDFKTKKSIRAKSFKLVFVAEKIIITPSNDGPRRQKYEVYSKEKNLGGEKEYASESHSFIFHIPEDIFNKIENWKDKKYYEKSKAIIEKLGLQNFASFEEYEKFYIKARFDIPLGIDIKNQVEFKIK